MTDKTDFYAVVCSRLTGGLGNIVWYTGKDPASNAAWSSDFADAFIYFRRPGAEMAQLILQAATGESVIVIQHLEGNEKDPENRHKNPAYCRVFGEGDNGSSVDSLDLPPISLLSPTEKKLAEVILRQEKKLIAALRETALADIKFNQLRPTDKDIAAAAAQAPSWQMSKKWFVRVRYVDTNRVLHCRYFLDNKPPAACVHGLVGCSLVCAQPLATAHEDKWAAELSLGHFGKIRDKKELCFPPPDPDFGKMVWDLVQGLQGKTEWHIMLGWQDKAGAHRRAYMYGFAEARDLEDRAPVDKVCFAPICEAQRFSDYRVARFTLEAMRKNKNYVGGHWCLGKDGKPDFQPGSIYSAVVGIDENGHEDFYDAAEAAELEKEGKNG